MTHKNRWIPLEIETTVTIDAGDVDPVELEVTVRARYLPSVPGTMYNRHGDPGNPPEAAEIEIDSITDTEGHLIPPTLLDDPDGLYEELMEAADEAEADAEDAEADQDEDR